MTVPPGRPGPDRRDRSEQHAEEVLEQALRALAGGSRSGRSRPTETTGQPGRSAPLPFTRLQVVLLAILVGLLVGMTAGVISLLT